MRPIKIGLPSVRLTRVALPLLFVLALLSIPGAGLKAGAMQAVVTPAPATANDGIVVGRYIEASA